ncbi:MAG TPA: LLM class flavin-dependent oxidoreductase [Solirubrobacterales bacterium]|nr:LLM class flavin-dependent oxidoreductase [Solirubrobacterales bacterium]
MGGRPIHCAVRVHQAGMSFAELLAIWREADRLGYDGASLYDLITAPALECWTTLSALSAATERVQAIPLVLAWGYRHPALLAKMAATLDEISGGRLILGLGAGGSRDDHERSGLPWRSLVERVSRLEEGVEVVRQIWRAEGVPARTRAYGTIAAATDPRPSQRPGPPILIGGHDERYLLPAAARVADICNIGFDMSIEEWQRKQRVLARHCDQAGRDPGSLALSHNATVVISRDPEEARARAHGLARRRPRAATGLASPLVGTSETCVSRIREYAALGVSSFFLLFPDLPDLSSLRLFAREVLPALTGR